MLEVQTVCICESWPHFKLMFLHNFGSKKVLLCYIHVPGKMLKFGVTEPMLTYSSGNITSYSIMEYVDIL